MNNTITRDLTGPCSGASRKRFNEIMSHSKYLSNKSKALAEQFLIYTLQHENNEVLDLLLKYLSVSKDYQDYDFHTTFVEIAGGNFCYCSTYPYSTCLKNHDFDYLKSGAYYNKLPYEIDRKLFEYRESNNTSIKELKDYVENYYNKFISRFSNDQLNFGSVELQSGVIQSLSNFMRVGQTLTPDVTNNIGDLLKNTNDLKEVVTKENIQLLSDIFSGLKGARDTVSNAQDSLQNLSPEKKLLFFALGLCSIIYLNKDEITQLVCSIGLYLGFIYIIWPDLLTADFWSKVGEKLVTTLLGSAANVPPPLEPVAEFQDGFPLSLSTISAGIVTLFFAVMNVDIEYFNLPHKLMSFLDSFDKRSASLESILTTFLNGVELIVNKIRCGLGFEEPWIFSTGSDSEFDSILSQLRIINWEIDKRDFLYTEKNRLRIVKLIDRIQDMIKKTPNNSRNIGLRTLLNNSLTFLMNKRKEFVGKTIGDDGYRQEPVGVLLKGIPGQGKSELLSVLSLQLTAKCINPDYFESFLEDPQSFIYNRQCETVYWDGYDPIRKFSVIFDDLGQIRDVAGNPDSEYMNIIRAINCWPYHLHVASMDGKANTMFKSKLVFATSNVQDFTSTVNSINSPQALDRRFHVVAQVTLKDDYCQRDLLAKGVRRIEPSSLPINMNGDSYFDPDCCNIYVERFNGKPFNKTVSYDQLLSMSYSTYQEHERRFLSKVDLIKDKVFSEVGKRKDILSQLPMLELQSGVIDSNVSYYNYLYDCYSKLPSSEVKRDILSELESIKTGFPHKLSPLGLDNEVDVITKFFSRVSELYNQSDFKDLVIPIFQTDKLLFDFYMKNVRSSIALSKQFVSYHAWLKWLCISFPGVDKPCVNMYKILYLTSLPDLKDMLKSASQKMRDIRETSSFFSADMLVKMKTSYTEFVNYLKVNIYDSVNSLHQYIQEAKGSTILKTFGLVMAGVGIAAGINKLITPTKKIPDFESSSIPHLPKSKGKSKSWRMQKPQVEHQYGREYDPTGSAITSKIVSRSLYEISHCGKTTTLLGYGLFVKGNVMMIPYHFMTVIKSHHKTKGQEDDYIMLRKIKSANGQSVPWYKFSVDEFLNSMIISESDGIIDYSMKDMTLLQLYGVHAHQDIRKFFVTDDDIMNMESSYVTIVVPGEVVEANHTIAHRLERSIPIADKVTGINAMIVDGYEYNALTSRGDCGALVVAVTRGNGCRRIMGIHTAGFAQVGRGFSTTTTLEDIDLFLEHLREPVISEECESDPAATVQSNAIVGDGRFGEIKEVPPVPQVYKTELRRSPLYAQWGNAKTKPCHLRPFTKIENGEEVTIDPMQLALKKFCSEPVVFSKMNMDLAAEFLYSYLIKRSTPANDKSIIPFEFAITGIDDDPWWGGISRSTSPGYPWIVEYKKPQGVKGKQHMFGADGDYTLNSEACNAIRKRVNCVIADAKRGVRNEFIFTDNLKDERRPIEKVESGKTRLFSGAPIDLLILYRMYFGSFMKWYLMNNIENGSSIGCNPYSTDWDRLARRLLRFSRDPKTFSNIGAGDYSAFDGSEKPQMHQVILEIINRWYSDGKENSLIRRVLWYELTNSKHINGGVVYEWSSSLPSGHPMTPFVNNLYNHLAFRMCWQSMFGVNFESAALFDDHVELNVHGDDNIFAVSEDYIGLFNENTISPYMSKLGLKYTREDKTVGCDAPLRTIYEVTYLKRSFRQEPFLGNIFVAPLDINTVIEIPYWTRDKGAKAIDVTKANVDITVKELALHGEEVFEEWTSIILPKVMANLGGYCPAFNTFQLALRAVTQEAADYRL